MNLVVYSLKLVSLTCSLFFISAIGWRLLLSIYFIIVRFRVGRTCFLISSATAAPGPLALPVAPLDYNHIGDTGEHAHITSEP